MAAVIIRQKDLKRLGKELLNEMFKFLHDEYILTEFREMEFVKEIFLDKRILNHINTLHRKFKITEEKRRELVERIIGEKLKGKELSEKMEIKENAMKDGGLDTEGIYHTLFSLNLKKEIDEDLYFKTKAFLDIFRVFNIGYNYLEN